MGVAGAYPCGILTAHEQPALSWQVIPGMISRQVHRWILHAWLVHTGPYPHLGQSKLPNQRHHLEVLCNGLILAIVNRVDGQREPRRSAPTN